MIDGLFAEYDFDSRGQRTDVDYEVGDPLTDEAYVYDNNGNRETVTNSSSTNQTNSSGTNQDYDPGPYNRLLDDGTYTYEYDDEGNLTKRTDIATGDYEIYQWDYRDRLNVVWGYDDNGTPTNLSDDILASLAVYVYDGWNQLVRRVTLSSSGTEQSIFAYDGSQVALQFDKAAAGNVAAGDLAHRYLWGPAVDQLLADEQVDWVRCRRADLLGDDRQRGQRARCRGFRRRAANSPAVRRIWQHRR